MAESLVKKSEPGGLFAVIEFEGLEKMSRRYRVIECLGSGGMGEVYRAWDEKNGCHVALKMLRSKHQPKEALRQRFSREIELLARVTHHNVVQVFDAGFHREQAFFTMEHVDGCTLRNHLDKGPLNVHRAVQLTASIADGLRAVHDVGVIHRDIKPENILVDNRGTAKLMDFGLAILEEQFDATRLTGVGQFVGTLACLPPEILEKQDYTVRSDVFQLGIVLYECLTGKAPWQPTNFQKLLSGECYENISKPSEIRADVPRELDDLVMKALSVSPSARYESAADFRDALMTWLDSNGQTEQVRRRYNSGRHRALKSRMTKRAKDERAGLITSIFPALVPVLHSSFAPYAAVSLIVTILTIVSLQPWLTVHASEDVKVGKIVKAEEAIKNERTDSFPPSASTLHRAVWRGDKDTVRRLMKRPLALKECDIKGNSPLHYAIKRGKVDIAEMLIASGADVNAVNEDGVTPLHEAAALGRSELVNVLLVAGAKVDAKGREGDTPVFWARCKGHMNVVEILEKTQAD